MGLSSDLISQFVKATNDNAKTKKETTAVYGTVKVGTGSQKYVQLDGSEVSTPVMTAVEVKDGDRVIVTIKNHTAIVTGNLSDPSANSTTCNDIIDNKNKDVSYQITELGVAIAKRVTTDTFNAAKADIEKLQADTVVIQKSLEASEADIDTLKADNATITEKLSVNEADITELQTNKLDVEVADAKYATVENLDATNANIYNLEGTYAEFVQITTDGLSAHEASIEELETKKLDAESAEVIYANIDFSNIGEAAIKRILADSGLIKDIIVGDGTVTGKLVGVTISGDLIEGNTVVAEKLVVKGDDGLYYKLNTDGITTEAEQTDYNSLNGSVIKAKSITATKISVDDLVAFDATIGGFNLTDKSIYSGAKASVDNTTQGIYLDKEGQMAIGDSSNYIKYYKDQNGSYKLKISAVNNLVVGSRNLLLNTGGNTPPVLSGGANANKSSGVKELSMSNGILTLQCSTAPNATYAEEIYYRFMTPTESVENLYCLSAGESYILIGMAKVVTTDGVLTKLAARTQMRIPSFAWTNDVIDTITEEDTDEWVPFESIFTVDPTATGCYTSLQLYFEGERWSGTIQIKELKLARGTKNTGWSPAPEDMLSTEKADGLYATKTSLAVESDRITASVTEINKLRNTRIGTRNLLINTCAFTEDNPITLTSNNTDGYALSFDGRMLYTPNAMKPGDKLFLQACTDAIWGDYHGYKDDSSKLVVNMWLYWYDSLDNMLRDQNSYIRASVYFGDGTSTGRYVWNITAPDNVHTTTGEWYARVRLNTYSDEVEYVTHRIWNIKLEHGDKATDWSPAPEDLANNEDLDIVKAIAESSEEKATVAQSQIQQLAESISMLVTDGSGASLMKQTENGWTFSTADIQNLVNATSEGLNDLTNEVGDVNNTVGVLQQAVNDLETIAEYVKIGTYEDEPCIELGEGDSEFKLRITNTRMIFTEGSTVLAYFNNKSLHIKKAVVEEELQQGGFVWKARSNGNLGLVWKGGTN